MSEVLRELVVSLSLDSDNFSRNIRTINQQIKEAESTFKLAGAGVTNFEKTVSGTQAKLSMLGSKLTDQNRAVDQYTRALAAANQRLTDSYGRQQRMTTELASTRAEYTRAKQAVSNAAREYKSLSASLGETDSATIAAKENLERFKAESVAARDRVKLLEGQIKSNTKTLQNNADAVSKAQTELNSAKAAVKATESEIKSLTKQLATMQSGWTKAGDSLSAFSKKADSVSKTFTKAGWNLTKYVSAPIVALGTTAVKASIDFESAFTSVRKTVDASESEFTALANSIKKMSTEVGTSSNDISEVTAIAGQLGIANDYLIDFTRTMIDLSNSTDIAATEGAATLAQFANITQMNQANFNRLGATLVELGNNYATTESAILTMAQRMAAAGHQVGLSESQILGFAAALSSVGLEAEAGGSTFSKALIKMEVAVQTGNKQLGDFAKVAGLTEKEFSNLWKSDPAGAFQAFIVGLSKMDEEGVSAIATLQDIGLSEIRLRDTLMRATNATELFAKTQKSANSAWADGTALTTEAGKRYATTANQLKNLKQTAVLFAQKVGDDLNPAVLEVITSVDGMLDKFQELDQSQRLQIVKWAGLAASAGPAIFAFGKGAKAVSFISGKLGLFSTAVGKAGGGFSGFLSVVGSSPGAVLAITAAVVAGTLALVDYASGAKAAREAIEGMNDVADKWASTETKTLYGSGGMEAFGLTAEDFTNDDAVLNMQQWKEKLIAVWTDGKNETGEIVTEWIDSFAKLNTGMVDELTALQTTATKNGDSGMSDQLQKDIDTLNSMNDEVAALLKKRQNGTLTDKDQVRLDELIDTREAIQIKYNLVPDTGADSGYGAILEELEIEKAQALARGESGAPTSERTGQALTAAAQGYGAVKDAIDEQYAAVYKTIQLMDEGDKKRAAQQELDKKYNADRLAASQEYSSVLQKLLPQEWNTEGVQKAGDDLDKLQKLFTDYSTVGGGGYNDPAILQEMEKITEGMNKDDLLNYITMLQQAQSLLDGGMSEEEVQKQFPELDMTNNLDQLAALADFAKNRSGDLEGLSKILNEIVPSEMQQIAVTLNLDGAKKAWAEFAENPGVITADAVVGKYTNGPAAAVPQPVVDALVKSYSEIEGGASTALLIPPQITAEIISYFQKAGVDPAGLTPVQVDAIVTAYSEATGANKAALLADFWATVKGYKEAPGATKPTIPLNAQISIIGYDLAAYSEFLANNSVVITGKVRLESLYENPDDALDDPSTKFYNGAGVEIPVTAVAKEQLTASTLAALDADGTVHVFVTPVVQGTSESVAAANEALGSTEHQGSIGAKMMDSTTLDDMAALEEYLIGINNEMKSWLNIGGWMNSWDRSAAAGTIENYLDPTEIANMQTAVAEAIAAMNNGETLSEDQLTNLQQIKDLVDLMDSIGVGENIVAGIAEGMTGAGMDTDAATVATNLQTAINTALGIQSPSTLMKPTGANVAAGVGVGMSEYSFGPYAAVTASSLMSALRAAITMNSTKSIGLNASLGLGLGILSGKAFVVAAITLVARAAVQAAKRELIIKSPSHVMRDEVGRMMTRGIGVGAVLEAKAQEKTIRNASRFLVDAAQGGVGAGIGAYDNRRTYNYNATSAVQVQELHVRDAQDVYSIAVEIAALTSRRQRGRGVRVLR